MRRAMFATSAADTASSSSASSFAALVPDLVEREFDGRDVPAAPRFPPVALAAPEDASLEVELALLCLPAGVGAIEVGSGMGTEGPAEECARLRAARSRFRASGKSNVGGHAIDDSYSGCCTGRCARASFSAAAFSGT